MKLSRKDVLHIARLARLGLNQDEVTKLSLQLSDILGQFEILQKVDTESVPPTTQSIDLKNVMRTDEASPSLETKEVLKNAPQAEDGLIRVRPVLE
jgi:aspartyl-tRNA(Asn)/glutamyl-tRNA(Gln) amidotransferase subunit C